MQLQVQSKTYKLCLSITLIGTIMMGQSAWACDIPDISEYGMVICSYEGLARVEKDGKWGLVNEVGQVVIPLIYDDVGHFSEGLVYAKQNGKYGFIDKKGQVVIAFKYDDARNFSEGLAGVKKNDKWGFVDVKDKVVLDFHYDGVWGGFENGQAEVQLLDDKTPAYFYVDKTGKVLTTRISLAKFRKNLKQGDEVFYRADGDFGRAKIIKIMGNLLKIQTTGDDPATRWVSKSKVYSVHHYGESAF